MAKSEEISPLIQAVITELNRQYKEEETGVYVYHEIFLPESIGVDGHLYLQPLVDAVINAIAAEACDGCGSTATMASLKAAGKISCCPERKMLSAAQWHARAVAAEARYTASGFVEIEERQLGQDRWKVLINRNGMRTLYEAYPTQAKAEVGKREAQEYLERVASTLPQPEAWVIINADETQFRVMDQGYFQWTDDLANAMFFATRASADQAAAEDLDDVRIVKRPIPKEA